MTCGLLGFDAGAEGPNMGLTGLAHRPRIEQLPTDPGCCRRMDTVTNDPKSEDQPAAAPATDANLDAAITASGRFRPAPSDFDSEKQVEVITLAHADPLADRRLPPARNLLDNLAAELPAEPAIVTASVPLSIK